MRRRQAQRGEITPGCIISLLVLLVMTIVGIKMIPVMMRVYEFRTEMEKMGDRANRTDYPPKRISKTLYEKAEQLRLPIGPKDIEVKKTEKYIEIRTEYTLEVEILFYTYKWHEKHEEVRPLF